MSNGPQVRLQYTRVFVSHENKLLRRIFHHDNCPVKSVLFAVYPTFVKIRGFGGEYASIVYQQILKPFGAQVLLNYKRFCAKCQPKDFTEFLSEHIYYNSHIVRDKNTFHDRLLFENCVTMVKHFISRGKHLVFC